MTSSICRLFLTALLLLATACVSHAQDDPFRTNVRPTPWLSPAQEQATFTLPPGFKIQLFASEPQIQKPMNMAFDARGRLWLTDTIEYPKPVPLGQAGRDTIKILEDTTGDGKADRITTFADGLNIPLGLIPYGEGCIVWSIPNIWYLRDTDADGRADRREKLYGPLGWERDTHGMNNGFTRGFDGWIYACHGFNNHTTVKGADGHQITMHSGNTYRFRPDGSRIEQYTHGQVNPFGMTITEFGDLITADCHSKPLYLLLRNGYYPSFGKPHDGLGYVPPIMTHTHGSTALCGPCYYAADHFPAEFRGNVFVGNVMTGRVNRNQLQWHGSTPVAVEQPDLVSSTDPWFRPVEIQQGPDGAVYVADFYNRIIGHYEVPLDHPGRDRTSGRIWRITYSGSAAEAKPTSQPIDLSNASNEKLLDTLASENLTQRLLALHWCVDHNSPELINELRQRMGREQFTTPGSLAAAASILEQVDRLPEHFFNEVPSSTLPPALVSRLVQCLSERAELSATQRQWLLALLDHDSYQGVVQRQVADALAEHAHLKNIEPLLAAFTTCPPDDTLLRHQLRLTLRNHLRLEVRLDQLNLANLDHELAAVTADAALGTDTIAAGNYLVAYLAKFEIADVEQATRYAHHAARFAADGHLDQLATALPSRLQGDPLRQLSLLRGIGEGLTQCGCQPSPALTAWARSLVKDSLSSKSTAIPWRAEPLAGKPYDPEMFVTEKRRSADGDTSSAFFGSLPRGEHLCGVYRSAPFEIPAELSFYIAGHNGLPGTAKQTGNKIRLLNAANDSELRWAPPPRNDTAAMITWDLHDVKGRTGYLEIVDADNAKAYAWLAVGRFSLNGLNPSNHARQLQAASELIVQWGLAGFETALADQLRSESLERHVQLALASALLASHANDPRLTALATLLEQPLSEPLRREIVAAVIGRNSESTIAALASAMSHSPAAAQQALADQLAASPLGARTLIDLVAKGLASPRLLKIAKVEEKLATIDDKQFHDRIAELTAALPPASEAIGRRIEQAQQAYTAATSSIQRGHAAFKKNCAICHKIGEEGAMIGPQLDGIGNRGLNRVLEDLLDPHRNVDIQFRTTTLVLTDGKILSGLLREPANGPLELIDSQGKPIVLDAESIEQRRASPLSLMPDNLVEKLSAEELNDLLAYLLSQTASATQAFPQ